MVFSSNIFLLYFLPIFLLIYYLTDSKYKNYVALVASIFFYSWGGPMFIFLILGTIVVDFFIVKKIDKANGKKRKFLLALSVILNIGLLGYFKYVNFFIDNFNLILSNFGASDIHWTKVALPIGISFFTFQKMTYSIDVYRKLHKPLKKVTDFALYIILFPQLIAGPIVRYGEIANQLTDRHNNETIDDKLHGFYRFIIGLSKKVLIANTMGFVADQAFAVNNDALNSSTAWLGILAYAFQIYFDFSGYSDMAIGIGRMIGFKFPENFDNPYISMNITEFWRRWHMTLGRWMKDYLYIPLGGSKVKSKFRLFFNLWIVFLISGFWHGAAWNFIIWGAFHGVFLILDRLFLIKFSNLIGKLPSIIITFIITLVGWVLFRAESMSQAINFIKKMFAFNFSSHTLNLNTDFWTLLIISTVFSFIVAIKLGKNIEKFFFYKNYNIKTHILISILIIIICTLCVSSITSSGFNPFIYFRF